MQSGCGNLRLAATLQTQIGGGLNAAADIGGVSRVHAVGGICGGLLAAPGVHRADIDALFCGQQSAAGGCNGSCLGLQIIAGIEGELAVFSCGADDGMFVDVFTDKSGVAVLILIACCR